MGRGYAVIKHVRQFGAKVVVFGSGDGWMDGLMDEVVGVGVGIGIGIKEWRLRNGSIF